MIQHRLTLTLLALLIAVFAFSEGTRQVAPNGSITIMGTNTTDIAALHLDHPSYDNFAAYTNPDVNDRLQIRILDPSSECVHLGFSAGHLNVTGMNPTLVTFEFRVKDPAGNIVYGPVTVDPASANINDWNEGFMGPEEINGPGGYDAMVITPADLMSGGWSAEGDYYIEFREVSGQPFLIDFWDITVADCSGTFPQERLGRVWSYNWAFFAINDFGFPERPFNGAFYVCAPDPDNADAAFVTKIDFNGSGFRPAAFVVAFNSFGSMNTGDVMEDRKSVQNLNSTQAEYAIFLNDPIESCETAVVGELELFGVTRCSIDDFCIKYQSSKEGQIDLLLDFDGPDSIYTPGTADLLIAATVTEDQVGVPACIDWDGLDGLGNPVPEEAGTAIPIVISYAQGVYHFPIYDAEFMDNGFQIEAIRPIGPEPLLYYDDSNIDTPSGSGEPDVQLSGCELPCHTWSTFNDPNVPGFGNLNTINSWWFAQQILTQQVFVLPTYFECGIEGPDVICTGDTAALSWTSTSLPQPGVDPNVIEVAWTGPGIIGEATGSQINIGTAGTYFADMTWLTPFGDTCATSCEFTLDEAAVTFGELDTLIGFRDTLIVNGEEYFETGEYEQVLVGSNGCDSILLIRLTVPETVLYYDLDACESYLDNGTNVDYSEFTPQYPNPLECGDLEASNIYRENPEVNPHSCTPGVDSSIAMCVGSLDGCDYDAESDKAVVFEITISPDTENNVVINSLSFWEKGPEEFDWIDGFDGPNNYPTLYGLRVLKDGVEIFAIEGVSTEREWNEEFYDFAGLEGFIAEDTSVYRFELLGYCTFDNGSTVNAWDLDEFTVHASCIEKVDDNGIIEGQVVDMRTGEPMPGIEIQVAQDPGFAEYGVSSTIVDGFYTYNNAIVEADNYVRASKNDGLLDGITVFDLLATQKHLLGMTPFTHDYQLIAADVNRDGTVTAADILQLRKLMLGQLTEFPNNTSWRFFNIQGEAAGNPFEWKEMASLPAFNGFAEAVNFQGVKVGDVINTSASASENAIQLRMNNIEIIPGQIYRIPVHVDASTEAMQFEMYGSSLEVVGIESSVLNETDYRLDAGILNVAWSNPIDPVDRGDELLTLLVQATTTGSLLEMMDLSNGQGHSMSTDTYLPIKLVPAGLESEKHRIELKASPNPASDMTLVQFDMHTSGIGSFEVMDISGRMLHQRQVGMAEGRNNIELRRSFMGGYSGVVICRLETAHGVGMVKVAFQ